MMPEIREKRFLMGYLFQPLLFYSLSVILVNFFCQFGAFPISLIIPPCLPALIQVDAVINGSLTKEMQHKPLKCLDIM